MILALAVWTPVAGCGGDDEKRPAATTGAGKTTEARPSTRTEGELTVTDRSRTERAAPPPNGHNPPEDRPGGAGDEEARAPALLTGRGGRITPRVVRVPPYIAVRVELRSADGREYGLSFGGESVTVGGRAGSRSTTTLGGMRPGEAIVGRPQGGGSAVRIVADAEPGP